MGLINAGSLVKHLEKQVAQKIDRSTNAVAGAADPGRGWPGANQGPAQREMTAKVSPGRAAMLKRMQKKMSATVGSQGPDKATLDHGTRLAKKWSKQLGKPYDPTYRKYRTPSGGTEYAVVGPDGKPNFAPRES